MDRKTVSRLPPLESLRFFEAAARHESFLRAADELGVTAAAVAYRVRALEAHLGAPLFERHRRGVRLTLRGQTYLPEVQRILAEVHGVTERHSRQPRRVRIISVEAVAEKWLLPRLAALGAAHPDIAIELETDHRGVDPDQRGFDAWIAYTGATAAPRPVTRRQDSLIEETLYEEQLFPVCSPALLAARGQPSGPAELDGWPLLYDLGWDTDWVYWSTCQHQPAPDLSRASGFRLYSMVADAAVQGLGAAIGRPALVVEAAAFIAARRGAVRFRSPQLPRAGCRTPARRHRRRPGARSCSRVTAARACSTRSGLLRGIRSIAPPRRRSLSTSRRPSRSRSPSRVCDSMSSPTLSRSWRHCAG